MKVHPAAEMFPMRSGAELQELADSIAESGLRNRIITYQGKVLSGRGRLAALALLGRKPSPDDFIEYKGNDPWGVAAEENRQWRNQTTAKKRVVVTKLLEANPEKSDRTVARQAGVSNSTVGIIRRELEDGVRIAHHDTRVGQDGVRQPARRPRRPRSTTQTPKTEEAESEPKPAAATVIPFPPRPSITEADRAGPDFLHSVLTTMTRGGRWELPTIPNQARTISDMIPRAITLLTEYREQLPPIYRGERN